MVERPPDHRLRNTMRDVGGLGVQAEHIDTINVTVPVESLPTEHRQVFGAVPPRAGCFQQRDTAQRLATVVDEGETAVLIGTQVLSGLGGVGKTQLAADYAHTLWDSEQVDLLVWISAGSRDAIVSGYTRLAIELLGADAEQSHGVRQLLQWLATTSKRWLIVLDDLSVPSDLHGLWPPHTPTGRVVVTTRRRDHALNGDRRHVIEVDLFAPEESVAYLTAKLPGQADDAAALAEELGHLPLALAQAAAYIADRRTLTCGTYRARLADRRRTLADLLPDELPDDHRATVAATWSLSIEFADQLKPVGKARAVLELASVLDPSGIPVSLFTTRAALTHLGVPDRDTATDALSCLHRLNLVTLHPGSAHRDVRAHVLVQRATREGLGAERLSATVRAAADALVEIWPEVEGDGELAACLRANTDALHGAAGSSLWAPEAHSVLYRAGRSLIEDGQTLAAIEYHRQLLAAAQQQLGAAHPKALVLRSNIAVLRGEAGDFAGAVEDLEQLHADQLRILGPDHPVTLRTRSNLAVWRGESGDLAGAVAELERLLAGRTRVFGPDHRDTLRTRSNLAVWRFKAGDLAGAVTELRQLVKDQERMLGRHHPQTVRTSDYLAYCSKIAALRGEP